MPAISFIAWWFNPIEIEVIIFFNFCIMLWKIN